MIYSNPNLTRLREEIQQCKAQIEKLTMRMETLQEAYEIIVTTPTRTTANESMSIGKDSMVTTTLYLGQEHDD